jgi:hypothetical protein
VLNIVEPEVGAVQSGVNFEEKHIAVRILLGAACHVGPKIIRTELRGDKRLEPVAEHVIMYRHSRASVTK